MKNLVLGVEFYVKNGWYGERYRFIFRGVDGEGFKNKREAGKYSSMLKKYCIAILQKYCKARNPKYVNGKVDAKPYEDFPTYIYGDVGPSYSCDNIEINADEFNDFMKKETAKLKETRERRNFFKK